MSDGRPKSNSIETGKQQPNGTPTSTKLPPPAPVTLGGALIPSRNASASSPLIVATSQLEVILKQPAQARRGANAATSPPIFITTPTKATPNPTATTSSNSALNAAAAANPNAAPSAAVSVPVSAPAPTPAPAVTTPLATSPPVANGNGLKVDTSKPVPRMAGASGGGEFIPSDDDEPASEEEPDSPPDEEPPAAVQVAGSAAAPKKEEVKSNHFAYLEAKTRQSVSIFTGVTTFNASGGVETPKNGLNGIGSAPRGSAKDSAGLAAAAGSPTPTAAAAGGKTPEPAKKSKAELTQIERTKLAEEIVSTEKTYLDGLTIIAKTFVLRIKKSAQLGRELIEEAQIPKLFLNCEELFDLHTQFYKGLKELEFARQLNGPELGHLFLKYIPFFKSYTKYVNSYSEASQLMRKARAERENFNFFIDLQEKCENMRVDDFTILPVQRVPRYLLLLKALIKCVDEKDAAFGPLNKALDAVSKIATEINASVHTREAQLRVLDIQNHLTGDKVFELVTPTRYYVRNGPLKKFYNKKKIATTGKTYYFFLFNDVLLYTTVPNSDGFCKGKHMLPLINMELKDIPDTAITQYIFEMVGSKKNILVQASSSADKYQWMTSITECITKLKTQKEILKQRQAISK